MMLRTSTTLALPLLNTEIMSRNFDLACCRIFQMPLVDEETNAPTATRRSINWFLISPESDAEVSLREARRDGSCRNAGPCSPATR